MNELFATLTHITHSPKKTLMVRTLDSTGAAIYDAVEYELKDLEPVIKHVPMDMKETIKHVITEMMDAGTLVSNETFGDHFEHETEGRTFTDAVTTIVQDMEFTVSVR